MPAVALVVANEVVNFSVGAAVVDVGLVDVDGVVIAEEVVGFSVEDDGDCRTGKRVSGASGNFNVAGVFVT